ncbi:lymphocyte antigen 96 isoform X5 [Athene noctua]|uniref:lymphocyte antigen 96 isoform X5 n=1 Tax=Athene noctua TaxID=126797 RepID=UPI003EBBF782
MPSCLHFWNTRVDCVTVVCFLSASENIISDLRGAHKHTCKSRSEFLCTSSDLELSYTFCGSDITFLKIVFNVWYEGANALHWKEILCSGSDDIYSVCGTLKGESFATVFDIKGSRIQFPKQMFQIILEHGRHFYKQLESELRNNKHTNFLEVDYIMYCLESYMMDGLTHL